MRWQKVLPCGTTEWLWFSVRLLALVLILGGSILYSVHMPQTSYRQSLHPLSREEQELAAQLQGHVHTLASQIGQRNIWTPGSMEEAAGYIRSRFSELGYIPLLQEFIAYQKKTVNIEVEIPGTTLPEESIVIGAHYDTVLNSPGANDNASGVAALLELARLLRDEKPVRTIRLVAFANEEPPFYYSEDMGSRHYARRARVRNEKIVAMLSLETMGCYSDAANSQRYPFPLRLFYPDTGNFIAFVGNIAARELVHRTVGAFRRHTAFPSEGLAAPAILTGIGWSDHWSFWQEGYPALMVTDTAFFRSADYHTAADTEEKLDYGRLARVVSGLARVIPSLSGTGE